MNQTDKAQNAHAVSAALQAIRAHIAADQSRRLTGNALSLHDQRLPPNFYERLDQARESHNRPRVHPAAGKSGVGRIKRALRELVVFYVNILADRQTAVNARLLESIALLAQEVEQRDSGPATVHIMTAALTPGDAISAYALICRRILRQWGVRVYLYADHVAPAYANIARHSRFYQAGGDDLLWFHYSIYTENVAQAAASPDFKIMDFHGISPPHLFKGQNAELEKLCRQGLDLLPALGDKFDSYIVHSQYVRDQLVDLGYPAAKIERIALCIDTTSFEKADDPILSNALTGLNYLLFVGRIVPQKDILALLEIFAHLSQRRADMALILVGSRDQAAQYQRQLNEALAARHMEDRVLFTGQINNPDTLAALFRQAQLYLVVSEWESFCVPVVESLYFGVPTAVHNVPPLPEVAGPAGLVIDKHAPEQAAQTILDLLHNRQEYERLRQMAASWSGQYTDKALAQALKKLFSALAQAGATPLNLIDYGENDV